MKYLPSIDRARVLRRMGSVLMLDKVALRRAMERQYAGQRQQKGAAIKCSNSGVAHFSRSSRGGNCRERRERERSKWESFRDQRTVSKMLAEIAESNCGW